MSNACGFRVLKVVCVGANLGTVVWKNRSMFMFTI
jgi:hypothetical protein